jgi:hypothetical protein
MHTHPARPSSRLAAAALGGVAALALAACGSGSSGGGSGSGSGSGGGSGGGSAAGSKVAFLMPDEASTRYEQLDRPGFVAEMM